MIKGIKKKKKPFSNKSPIDSGGTTKTKRETKPLVEHQRPQKWYEYQFDEVLETQKPEDNGALHFQQMQKRAEELLHRDTEHFSHWYRTRNRGDADWLQTITQKGTFADRLSALQLSVQRSPVHALPELKHFVELVHSKGAKIRQAHSVTQALKELFLDELLPPDRKLLQLNQRPLDKYLSNQRDPNVEKRLILWQFEAQLKSCYQQFIEGLQALAGNIAEGVAQNACQNIAELLKTRPEQEQFLLSALVNKLGHPLHRVGAKVALLLEKLVHTHPNMRSVVVKEVEQLMFRKNISPRAQRYALHFLSRLLLVAGEFELALQLIQIYLRMFRILVEQDALTEHRLFPLLITGLNRVVPYAKGQNLDSDLLQDVDNLYAIVQTAKFSTALSVLRLLFMVHNRSSGLTDRFYCAFYRRLLNTGCNSGVGGSAGGIQQEAAHQLFELVQRVLKNDLVECRVRAFLKRLFQIALASNSAFAAATLLTCHAVIKERPHLLRLDSTLSAKMENCEEEESTSSSSDEDEVDQLPDDGIKKKKKITKKNADVAVVNEKIKKKKKKKVPCGWIHRNLSNGIGKVKNGQKTKIARRPKNTYDPTARNPLFAGADFASDTELHTLARHYHPTVAVFARALIRGEPIHYKSDPLIDLSHMRFLDRLAFKNPKTRYNKKKQQQLQPESGVGNEKQPEQPQQQQSVSLFAHSYAPTGVKAMNPMSQDYVSKSSTEIPVEERFLHHFAALKFRKNKMLLDKRKKKHDVDSDDEEVDDFEEEEKPGKRKKNRMADSDDEEEEDSEEEEVGHSKKRRKFDVDSDDEEEEEEEEEQEYC